jgi:hypothetical protein
LEPYAKERGAEVLISDDNDSYGVASVGMGLSHQLCVAHVRKYLKRRSESILEQAEEEWGNQDGKYKKLEEDLKRLRELLEELPEEGGKRIGRLHREYLWAQSPRKGQAKKACAGYRMRMLTLELWNKWPKIRLYLIRPELESGWHQQRQRALHRQEQGQIQDDAPLQERRGDEKWHRPHPVALRRGGRA